MLDSGPTGSARIVAISTTAILQMSQSSLVNAARALISSNAFSTVAFTPGVVRNARAAASNQDLFKGFCGCVSSDDISQCKVSDH